MQQPLTLREMISDNLGLSKYACLGSELQGKHAQLRVGRCSAERQHARSPCSSRLGGAGGREAEHALWFRRCWTLSLPRVRGERPRGPRSRPWPGAFPGLPRRLGRAARVFLCKARAMPAHRSVPGPAVTSPWGSPRLAPQHMGDLGTVPSSSSSRRYRGDSDWPSAGAARAPTAWCSTEPVVQLN